MNKESATVIAGVLGYLEKTYQIDKTGIDLISDILMNAYKQGRVDASIEFLREVQGI